jgi:hypothetical protein
MSPRTSKKAAEIDDMELREMLVTHIAAEETRLDTIIRALFIIGSLSTMILASWGWVYFEDRADNKAARALQNEMMSTIKTMLLRHEELEKDVRREFDRVEKQLDNKAPKHNWQAPG